MIAHDGFAEELDAVGQWSEALEKLHGRIARRFARSEARERVQRYLLGLLGRVERKIRLAAGRGHWRNGPAGRPEALELGEMGRRPRARRPQGVCRGASRR